MDASVNRIPSSKDERAFLIGIKTGFEGQKELEYSLEELSMLVKTAGGVVAGTIIIKREKIDPAYVFGRGYVDRIREIVEEKSIRLIVFDLNGIRPAQIRNLEDLLKCRVIGRHEVILDIFARRARSSEAKMQVELAQLKYILPRLKGLGGVLSRLGGGIGTRGPGEKMLETDRRHIQRRIKTLTDKMRRQSRHRETVRKSRAAVITGAVVGYTNAGKSSLINLLAKDDLFVEDRLFATLDSYTRSVYLNPGLSTLLTDTVGFIRNLPANLIESFRSTLEDIARADYLVHVVDITAADVSVNIATVNHELNHIDCGEKPVIVFLNKTDLLDDESIVELTRGDFRDAVSGSVHTGVGIEALKIRIAETVALIEAKTKKITGSENI